jgi:uncharacterized membrane protein (DUF485 family)
MGVQYFSYIVVVSFVGGWINVREYQRGNKKNRVHTSQL